MDKTTGAIVRDGKEFNCCESTLMIVNREHSLPGFDSNILKAASPMGGGVGCWGSVCGAATGIVMALGLVYGTDGERLEVRGTDHLEFREGKIIKKNSFWKIVEK